MLIIPDLRRRANSGDGKIKQMGHKLYTQKLRGVNLGGWLLLERWMTPSLFAGTHAEDEYTFMSTPGAEKKLEQHRRSFISKADFKWLADHGVNAVRIPVGYWVLEDDTPYKEAIQCLDWAMETAKRYKLQVVIDVHGLPGSQNGRDHSGRKGRAMWLRHGSFRRRSLDVLAQIAQRYRDNPYFWGLQITNEPKLGLFQFKLRRYYRAAYDRLAQILRPHTRIIFSDGFTPRLLSGVLGNREHPVAMDTHLYHMTTPLTRWLPIGWYFRKVGQRRILLARLTRDQPVIIGEWSSVLRGETMSHLPPTKRESLMRQHAQHQLATYGDVAGWFYWNYKTEEPGPWNFRWLVESGKMPSST